MTLQAIELVDHEQGLVSRKSFIDPAIYRLEVERIFGRCWLYLAHETQLPAVGDFLTTRMGEEPVILCRAAGGRLFAFANTCPGCFSLLCTADEGQTDVFRCPYHGWRFGLDGEPVLTTYPPAPSPAGRGSDESMPARRTGGILPLAAVAQIDGYKGCIFATFDPDAAPLGDYLGDIRWGLDLLLEQGALTAVNVVRWRVNCNWKFAAESSINETLHGTAHLSGLSTAAGSVENYAAMDPDQSRPGFTIITEYGHGLNAEFLGETATDADDPPLHWRSDPAIRSRLGSFRMRVGCSSVTVFPNLLVNTLSRQIQVWHPRGPTQMEAVLTTFANEDDPPEIRRQQVRRALLLSGPAGLFGQDESECWEQSTRACRSTIAGRYPLNYQMGLGRGRVIDDELSPPRIESLLNEHRQLWFYRNWAQALDAPSWREWRKTRPRVPPTV